MNVRTLKRKLHHYGLRRRNQGHSEHTVREIIKREIECPSSLLGYRGMWNKLRTSNNVTVPRDMVMRILRELDPDASALRKARKLQRRSYVSPGPNATWHVDGYDKLKPYGLPIHGCVDGFSRRIMWLEVCKSNNDPVIPAGFFLHAVEENGMRPMLVQTDCGTENGILAGLQCLLAGEVAAHRYSSSHANQRVENWWSHCKRGFTAWVRDFFKALVAEGKLSLGNHLQMECVWFVFSDFLQLELEKVKHEWNMHYIRRSRHDAVSGIPDELYYLPHTRGFEDCGSEVSADDIDNILNQRDIYVEAELAKEVDDELLGFFKYVEREEGLTHPPADSRQAKDIYEKIASLQSPNCLFYVTLMD